MPALARGQENTPSIINWFTTINGVLTDMFEIGFQIWDVSAGLPGSVIFPTPGDTDDWEDVTDGGGHYSVGHYYAYDNDNVQGFTPGLGENLGTHRTKWRWKASAGAPYQSGEEDFEVLVQSAGGSSDTYISVQDIRDLGITEEQVDDPTVLAAIELWQAFLDRACRQWFNARTKILSIDGNDSDTLFFGVPIISIDYIKINNEEDELNTDYYRVYNNQDGWPDDRRNPRVKLIRSDSFRDIFTSPISTGHLKFRKGRQNQEVKGTFGFVESDGSTPKLIKRALTKLVIEKLGLPIFGSSPIGSLSPMTLKHVIEEKTDGHSMRYSDQSGLRDRRPGLSGITQDQEILDIIKLYKAPLGLASPADWTWG